MLLPADYTDSAENNFLLGAKVRFEKGIMKAMIHADNFSNFILQSPLI
jgi:hypothetical protein